MLDAYSVGMDSLKKIQGKYTLEHTEEIMDNLGEVLANQKELDNVIGAKLPSLESVDEDELERELELLIAEGSEKLPEKVLVSENPKGTEEKSVEEKSQEVAESTNIQTGEDKGDKEETKDEQVDELAELVGAVNISHNNKEKELVAS